MKKTIVSTVLLAFTAIVFFAACKRSDSATNVGASGTLTVDKASAKKGEVATFTVANLNMGTSTLIAFSWVVTPVTGGASINYAPNSALISFASAGTYSVTVNILDSLTKKLLGSTNSVTITVTSQSINPVVVIQTGDVLNLQPVLSASDTGGISLKATSTMAYQYSNYNFSYDAAFTSNNYALNIGGVMLPAGVSGAGAAGVANTTFYLGNLAAGTYPISITWLGTAYTGSLSVVGTKYSFTWSNESAVKIFPLTVSR